ncbi:MAG: cardiolipin synthase [Thermovirgaceae bacterium]
MSWSPFLILIHNITSIGIRLAMIALIPRWHQPAVATAWLLVIFFWPIPGLFFYLLIGGSKLPGERIARHERMLARLERETALIRKIRESAPPSLPERLERFCNLATTLGDMPITGGNDVQFITSSEELVKRLSSDIDNASEHIHLLYYILNEDKLTRPLFEALERAAGRGVTCRILADTLGSKKFLKKTAPRLREAGISVVGALPPSLFRRIRATARFDLRNHRKLAVIDGKKAYTGSHNLIDPTYGGKARGRSWHDVTIAIEGPATTQLQRVFLEDWYVETNDMSEDVFSFTDMALPGSALLQTVPSGPSYPTENYQRLVVSALHAARRRVIITTPYLIPDEGLIEALEVAVLGGARVQLIVPEQSDQFLVGNAARSYYEQIMELGVELYLYQPGILHSKTMTVDSDTAFIGTSNFDIRSFALNFELNMILYHGESLWSLRNLQESYMEESRRLSLEEWRDRSLVMETIQGITKLFSPLL